MTASMKVRKGVSVPMDTVGISPDSLEAAFAMGIRTLFDRSTAAGEALDWSTIEMALNPGPSQVTLLVVRAEVQS